MHDAINKFKGSQIYNNLLDSFIINEKIHIEDDRNFVSEAIYFHLCKFKYAGWRHRINFNRKKKHSISDFFQDIVAFYLRACLPDEYSLVLEEKKGKLQPDIVVKMNKDCVFVIELKTNLGYERPDKNDKKPFQKFTERICNISKAFEIPKENIIYVFEEHSNVSKDFSSIYWDDRNNQAKRRPSEFPYSYIYPLFNQTDPYYWKHDEKFNRTEQYIELTDSDILDKAAENIVTPFEDIIRKIKDNQSLNAYSGNSPAAAG